MNAESPIKGVHSEYYNLSEEKVQDIAVLREQKKGGKTQEEVELMYQAWLRRQWENLGEQLAESICESLANLRDMGVYISSRY